MELRLDGKTALVTGGSRGIGQAIALAFADAGASVMISSRNAEGLETSATEIRSRLGDRAGPVAWTVANAGDPEQAEACVAATVDLFGGVDMLVNNAATNPYYGPIIDIDQGRADKTVRVNQSGYLEWTQAAWRAGMADRGGVVLNIASIGGLTVEGGIGWYNVTKAAVIHLTAQLAGELGPAVRVNAIAPGLVKTQLAQALWEPGEEKMLEAAADAATGRAGGHRQRRAVPVLGRRVVDHGGDPGRRRRLALHRQRLALLIRP